jgi:plastocyanin
VSGRLPPATPVKQQGEGDGYARKKRTGLGQLAPGTTRFRVTFTSPGTYPYACAFQDDLGMKGEVIVLP